MSNGSKPSSSTFHLLAGIASGFTTSILLQPFDLLKTRVQQQSSNGRATLPIFKALRAILAEPSPVKQLWRGTLPSVIRTSIGSGLYFASLERLRRSIAHLNASQRTPVAAQTTSALPKLGVTANLLTGALARASVGFVMMPITVLKVRFESNIYTSASNTSAASKNPYTSLPTATRQILHTEGVRGFFKGAGATALRDAPYAGIYLGFYESSKTFLSTLLLSSPSSTISMYRGASTMTDRNVTATNASIVHFLSGALAAALATTATNPPDVVKTRLQLMPDVYRNAAQAVKVMVKEEGWRSLWGGLGLRVGRKALSSALAWTVYEEAVRRAGERWDRDGRA